MGDPVWLPEVLREAGLRVRTHAPHGDCGGYLQNGHGDFGAIDGVMFHHTGSFGETENGIAHHPTLDLCSQCLVTRDGTWVVCGVGIAYHGGRGGGIPWLWDPNEQLIGVEVANDGGGSPGKPHRTGWSDEQYDSVVTGMAAILKKLGKSETRVIGHKEWAGAAQGKWDPGAIDMGVFRRDVANAMLSGKKGSDMGWLKEPFKNFKGIGMAYEDLLWWLDKNNAETREQLLGPDGEDGKFKGWKILGRSKVDPKRDNTVPEAIAEIRDSLAEMRKALVDAGLIK